DAAPRGIDVLLANGVEMHPELAEAAAFERTLLGSGPDAIRAVRDPQMLPTLPPHPGLGFCAVRTSGRGAGWFGTLVARLRGRARATPPMLRKKIHATDGTHITEWDGRDVPLGWYLQQAIAGKPVAAAFYADGWSSHLLGVTEQLVGEPLA